MVPFSIRRRANTVLATLVIVVPAVAIAQAAPPPSAAPGAVSAPTTAVMASLSLAPGVDRAKIAPVMPNEVRATLQLYLDGKIQQWYSRSDGRGVIFIMNCASAAEAKKITDTLPLVKAGLASFEFTELAPLAPLRALLASAPSGGGKP